MAGVRDIGSAVSVEQKTNTALQEQLKSATIAVAKLTEELKLKQAEYDAAAKKAQ